MLLSNFQLPYSLEYFRVQAHPYQLWMGWDGKLESIIVVWLLPSMVFMIIVIVPVKISRRRLNPSLLRCAEISTLSLTLTFKFRFMDSGYMRGEIMIKWVVCPRSMGKAAIIHLFRTFHHIILKSPAACMNYQDLVDGCCSSWCPRPWKPRQLWFLLLPMFHTRTRTVSSFHTMQVLPIT